MPPRSASRHYRRLQRLQAVTISAVRRAWRRMEPSGSWEDQYQRDVGPKVTALVVAAQVAAARESDSYVADVLNEMAFGPSTEAGVLLPQGFAGYAGDGRPVESLLATSVGRARASLAAAQDTPEAVLSRTLAPPPERAIRALADAEQFMEMVTQTILADAARAAESAAMAQRPWVEGWIRAINPPCCSRCAVLSGKFYLFNEGFLRHPRCDCHHIPAPSDPEKRAALMGSMTPDRYFDSLTETEQDRIFTKAGAEAVRLGADIGQVVNARRGMSTAGTTRTREGLTAAGEATRLNVSTRRAAYDSQGLLTTTTGTTRRGRASGRTRLMPESILALAGDDRVEAIRLLRLYGYIK